MNFSQDETAQILMSLGYEVNRTYKFKMRDERTASASIHPQTGKIKDFGSGWGGSIIDFMVEYHNFSKKEAFSKASYIIGKEQAFKPAEHSHTPRRVEQKPFITQEYIDKFALERKENFSRYWELLSQTLPAATKSEKEFIAKRYEIGYSKQADRLIMPIRDENGNCLTFWKYNKNPKPFMGEDGKIVQLPKVMFSKNRPRCPFNLQDLKEYVKEPMKKDDTIFILEGEKDCLNALACGYKAITIGSASTRIDEKYLPLFKGLTVSIAYDLDEAGREGAAMLQEQLKNVCEKIEIIDWRRVARKVGIDEAQLGKGFDFTDFLFASQNQLQADLSKKKSMER